ncbi:uncharacterized protein LOC133814573 [Humulus lupulus]|uniref:uncharacterized protein LOC133814573 n=1 Tax=Humulus lupulus TaxID=3486 RepID=UPI002B403527|nr:uncharacterized protein LOC133814573 [Humulus lupulus]
MEQPIDYEWLPTKCTSCKKLGHTTASCKHASDDVRRKKEPQIKSINDSITEGGNDTAIPSSSIQAQQESQEVPHTNSVPNVSNWVTLRRPGMMKTTDLTPPELHRNSFSVLQEQQKHRIDPILTSDMNGILQYTELLNKVGIGALIETKIKGDKIKDVMTSTFVESDQFLHSRVRLFGRNQDFCLTIVYGSSNLEARKMLWSDLTTLQRPIKPWILLGYFNVVFNVDDRLGGRPISVKEMEDARQWLALGMATEMKTLGPSYTWSNKQEGGARIFSKLDRVFTNENWSDAFPLATAFSQWDVVSDHSFLLIKQVEVRGSGVKPFRFYNMWSTHAKFRETVLASWHKPLEGQCNALVTLGPLR